MFYQKIKLKKFSVQIFQSDAILYFQIHHIYLKQSYQIFHISLYLSGYNTVFIVIPLFAIFSQNGLKTDYASSTKMQKKLIHTSFISEKKTIPLNLTKPHGHKIS